MAIRNQWTPGCVLAVLLPALFVDPRPLHAQEKPSVEEAQKQLSEAFAKIRSGRAKTKTVQDFTLPSGQRLQAESMATVEWLRKDDAILYRSELVGTQSQAGGSEIELSSEGKWTRVSDGRFFYVVSTQHGMTTAAKYKPDPGQFGEPTAVLENLRKNFKIKRLPDEKLNGYDCIVFELTPLTPDQSPTAHTTSYFRKDIGLNIKNISFDHQGRQAFVSETIDIEIDVPVSEDRFVFTPPPGVEVEDKTQQ